MDIWNPRTRAADWGEPLDGEDSKELFRAILAATRALLLSAEARQ